MELSHMPKSHQKLFAQVNPDLEEESVEQRSAVSYFDECWWALHYWSLICSFIHGGFFAFCSRWWTLHPLISRYHINTLQKQDK